MFISGKRMVSADNSKHSYKDNDNMNSTSSATMHGYPTYDT